MKLSQVRIPPLALAIVAAALQRLLPYQPRSHVRNLLAFMVGTVATILLTSSVAKFRNEGTTVNPIDPNQVSTLVVNGPNALTRNPMYVGMAGLLGAHALWRGSLSAWLPVAGFIAWLDRRQIPTEEVALEQRFGDEFDDYRSRVPRWLGSVSRTT